MRVRLAHILDLFGEDSWRNVYAGELEVRPPDAPTIQRAPTILALGARPGVVWPSRGLWPSGRSSQRNGYARQHLSLAELQQTFESEFHVHRRPIAIESKVTDGARSAEQVAELHWCEVTSDAAINRDQRVPVSEASP
jgi:hypothetical protein